MPETKTEIFSAVGRRKTSTAQVNIKPGSGKLTINHRELADYFPTPTHRTMAIQPLIESEKQGKIDVQVRIHGGGLTGQAGAMSQAISRALIRLEPELRPALKSKGLLTRDSRMKERKKSGQPGARKRFQFSKR